MRLLFFILFLATSTSGFAAYDSSWFQDSFWSGEYPTGFAVAGIGVSVPARTAMDLDRPKDIQCGLPRRAVFHPWNVARRANYRTASKIVVLTAKEEFKLGDGVAEPDQRVTVKKGETFEYLMYAAEGIFTVRFNGKQYQADQGIFAGVEPFDENQFREDAWLSVKCRSGKRAWLFIGDLVTTDAQGEVRYFPGLDSWRLGLKAYGTVTDVPRHKPQK